MRAFAYRSLKLVVASVLCAQFSAHAQQTFTTFQAASTVVGQANFTDQITTGSQTVTDGPTSVAMSATGKMAIGDETGDRVLIWNSIPTSNGAPADVVVGQPDFNTTLGGISASRTNLVEGVAFSPDGSKLLVCDWGNNRVLIWNTVPTTNGQPADVVVGQTDLVSGGAGLTASEFAGPSGVLVTPAGQMVITDSRNNRVLIFNSIPTTNGTSADLAIGQLDLSSKLAGTGRNNLSFPWSSAFTGDGKLLVVDQGNNRVLVFKQFPSRFGPLADFVIGQNRFGANGADTTASSLNTPVGAAISGDGQLAIGELGNNRVLIYNDVPASDGAAADVVLGQPDFTSGNVFNGGVSAQSMATAYQLAFAPNGRLLVPGRTMHRVMIFGTTDALTSILTVPATSVVPAGAQLNGSAIPDGASTVVHFEYSTDPGLAGAISTPAQNVGAGIVAVPFNASITGLLPKTTYYFRAVATNSGGTVFGEILNFNTQVLNWGTAGSDPTTGVLDPTLIPTGGTHTFTNVNGQGYNIVVTTSNLNAGGGALYFGDTGWWFEGGGPDFGYGTVTYRFFDTVTGNPHPISGVDFRLLDAERDERFRTFGYWTASNGFILVPYGDGRLTFSHGPIFHASDNSYENNAPMEPGNQVGKWIELNLSDLSVTGFSFQAHRQTASAGSVIMSDLISPFASWRDKYFGPVPYPPAADDFANPDGDASVNILEYFYGTNPTVLDPINPLQMSVVAGKVTLIFPRDTSATDATGTVQGADSATGPWTDLARSTNGGPFAPLVAGVDVAESPSGQIRNVVVSDLFLMGDPAHPNRFLRLQVVH